MHSNFLSNSKNLLEIFKKDCYFFYKQFEMRKHMCNDKLKYIYMINILILFNTYRNIKNVHKVKQFLKENENSK